MKRKLAFLLALVMALALAIGVVPASAATTTPVNLAKGATFELVYQNGCELYVREGGYGVIQMTSPTDAGSGNQKVTVYAMYGGTATVDVRWVGSKVVEKTYQFNVSNYGNNNLVDATGADITLTPSYNNNYAELFVGDTFTVSATVTKGGQNIGNRVNYSWSVVGGNAEVVSGGTSSRATFRVTKGGSTGANVAVKLIVTGNGASSEDESLVLGKLAYGGTLYVRYFDTENNNAPITNANALGLMETFTNLPRNYNGMRAGTMLTMSKMVSRVTPASVTFTSANPTMTVDVYVRSIQSGGGWIPPIITTPEYLILSQFYPTNPYVVISAIEGANNLSAMTPGSTQQITDAMLGGVPVDAPGMSYVIADPSIATVDANGLIKAKKAGMTVLRVYCGKTEIINKYLFVVGSGVVEDDPVEVEEGLDLGLTSVTRDYETQKNIRFRSSAKKLMFNGELIEHTDVEWSSSKTSVATVDEDGYITIKGKGTCYIYGTYTDEDGEEYTSRFKVKVK